MTANRQPTGRLPLGPASDRGPRLFGDGTGYNLPGGDYASRAEAQAAGAATLNDGAFINAVIDLLIIAFIIFMVTCRMNRWRRRQDAQVKPPPAPTTKDCPFCLSPIPVKATRCAHCTFDLTAAGPTPGMARA